MEGKKIDIKKKREELRSKYPKFFNLLEFSFIFVPFNKKKKGLGR
jgi:hypothetical protein